MSLYAAIRTLVRILVKSVRVGGGGFTYATAIKFSHLGSYKISAKISGNFVVQLFVKSFTIRVQRKKMQKFLRTLGRAPGGGGG